MYATTHEFTGFRLLSSANRVSTARDSSESKIKGGRLGLRSRLVSVDDLTRVYLAAIENRDSVDGLILNIGGGPGNALSIWSEFGLLLEEMLGHPIPIERGEWRQGDQPIYISDISRAKTVLGWTPSINPSAGLRELFEWVTVNLADIERVLAARLGKAK
jgi:nucleoside-diphosphate-sugar epimerase